MLVIFGSINLTAQYHVKTLPSTGKNIKAMRHLFETGGHAARQAIAAARYDTKTALIGKVGEDANGLRLVNSLKRNNVVTSGIAKIDEVETGLVTEIIAKDGQRQTVQAIGANEFISAEQVPENIVSRDNILLVQPDLSLEETVKVMMMARNHGGKVILHFYPFIKLPKEVLALADIIIMSEDTLAQATEHLSLSIGDAKHIGQQVSAMAKADVIVHGKKIHAVQGGKDVEVISIPKLPDLIETDNAMDAFSGIFAASLHDGDTFNISCKKAAIGSALASRHYSAQKSYPYRADIEELM